MGESPFKDKSLLEAFRKGFKGSRYPEGFLDDYEIMECFARSDAGETLLVKDRNTGVYHVAKCYINPALLSSTTENELLKNLCHSGLPAFAGEYRNESMLCVVREYAQGQPLDVYASETGFTQDTAVSVGMQLCDILAYLHGQTPPVIHRDIKPQNIIIDKEGHIKLIDFGISRVYNEQAREDTVCFATKYFAAPEQYGFSQTDCKADIFSLGVLLGWMLTGEMETEKALPEINKPRLRKILGKCAAFAPEKRYVSAARVKTALRYSDGSRQKRALRWACAAMACIVFLAGGFALGRFTDVRPPIFYSNSNVYFDEPILDQAVRLQLGKTEHEPIRNEELDNVKELYIYAGRIAKTQAEMNELRGKVDRGEIAAGNGSISNLNDIERLKNLQNLSLGHQDFTDLSPLMQLSSLQSLELYECPITDIGIIRQLPRLKHFALTHCEAVTDLSPLADCTGIRELILVDCLADDYSALASLGELDYLHMINMDTDKYLPYLKDKTVHSIKIAASSLASVNELKGIKELENLELDGVKLKSLSGIESLPDLKNIGVWNMPRLDLTPLKALPDLETVTLTGDMRDAAQALAGTDIQITYK